MAACPACTFINADDATACEMCGAQLPVRPPHRPKPPPSSSLRPLHARERRRRERLRGVRRVVVPAVHALRARGRRVLRRLWLPGRCGGTSGGRAPPAPITPEDVANKDYRPRRVERARGHALDALERIVDEPARFVALACGEQPPAAARPVGRVADPEPGEPAAGRVADEDASDDGADDSGDEADLQRRRRKLAGGVVVARLRRDGHDARELLAAHCVARHVRDADEVRRRRAARPPRKKRRAAPADDLDDFIVADDETSRARLLLGELMGVTTRCFPIPQGTPLAQFVPRRSRRSFNSATSTLAEHGSATNRSCVAAPVDRRL